MEQKKSYQHWKMEIDEDRILWLTLDREGASVNSMNREVFDEFDRVLDDITDQRPLAVIIQSGKKKGFIAGADITQFTSLTSRQDAFDLIRQAQLVLDKLEALPMPTVAMINGFCLGGGCEVVLACRYRVAEDSDATKIGLPEVKLGIHPGWGGTVRLPKLIGAAQAMKIMLPGSTVPARVAEKIGLVDVAVPLRELKRAAKYYALQAPPPHQPKGLGKYSNVSLVRPCLGRIFYKKLAQKVNKEHYPAPFAILHNWIKEGVDSHAYYREAESIADLLLTETSRNLVRVFFLQNELKGLAKEIKYLPKHIHVIGAGTMGGDIAAWCALQGFPVTLQDQSPKKIAPAIKRAHALYKDKLKKPWLIQAALDRLQPDVEGKGIKKADLIIEAIFEDLTAKRNLFKEIEPQIKEETILATNTSSIPLDEINTILKNKSRLVGMHFFNPVAKMPLVEVVFGTNTSPEITKKAVAFVSRIGKFPLTVTSTPGFLVNRVLMPYLLEAMELLQENIPPHDIDKAAVDFGMPMGPVELADTVGLDVCLSVAENLVAYYGGKVPEKLRHLVAEGSLGVKSGRGFYRYKNGKAIKEKAHAAISISATITDRLILRMLNEAVTCLHEQVVQRADLLDAGMVFGTGFAPFHGGPLRYAKSRGIDQIVNQLERFSAEYGDRFKPQLGWSESETW